MQGASYKLSSELIFQSLLIPAIITKKGFKVVQSKITLRSIFLNTIKSINLKIHNSAESKKSGVMCHSSGMHDLKKPDVLPSSEVCGVTAKVG
jgi:hypothetical protein